jgi:hypothetical protein
MRNLPRYPRGVREQEGQLARLGWLAPYECYVLYDGGKSNS